MKYNLKNDKLKNLNKFFSYFFLNLEWNLELNSILLISLLCY